MKCDAMQRMKKTEKAASERQSIEHNAIPDQENIVKQAAVKQRTVKDVRIAVASTLGGNRKLEVAVVPPTECDCW